MKSNVHHTVLQGEQEQNERSTDDDDDDDDGQEPNQSASATGTGTRYTIARTNATTIARLPDPTGDDPWFRFGEVDLSYSLLCRLQSIPALEEKGSENNRRWKIKENIYEEATKHAKKRSTFDCGCTGINNVPGGGIECSGCGIEYPRETVKEVLSNQ